MHQEIEDRRRHEEDDQLEIGPGFVAHAAVQGPNAKSEDKRRRQSQLRAQELEEIAPSQSTGGDAAELHGERNPLMLGIPPHDRRKHEKRDDSAEIRPWRSE